MSECQRTADILALSPSYFALTAAIETAEDERRSPFASRVERRIAETVFQRLSAVKHDLDTSSPT